MIFSLAVSRIPARITRRTRPCRSGYGWSLGWSLARSDGNTYVAHVMQTNETAEVLVKLGIHVMPVRFPFLAGRGGV